MKGAEILNFRPEFAMHVRDVCLEFRSGMVYPTAIFGSIAEQLNHLQNLRTLRIQELYDHRNKGFDAAQIRLPRLNSLVVVDCSRCCVDLIAEIINSHHDTLTTLGLYHHQADDTNPAYGTQRNTILENAKILRKQTVVKLRNPRVYASAIGPRQRSYNFEAYVSFAPPYSCVADKGLISVFRGMEDGVDGLHYSTQAGNLHESLECMIRNYKEFTCLEEMRLAGVPGGEE